MALPDDQELFELLRRDLYTAVIGDVMDTMGLLHQFLPPEIRPLRDDMVVIGRAMPVLQADFFAQEEPRGQTPLSTRPFGVMLEALDDLKPGEIYLATGGSASYAVWGELMTTRAQRLGAAGVVLNSYTRDTSAILALNFPTFARGSYAQDQGPRGKAVDFRVAVEIGGVRIAPGDLIFGDVDGVLVIPQAAAEEAIQRALEKVRGEHMVRDAIEQGMSASEAFARYGVM